MIIKAKTGRHPIRIRDETIKGKKAHVITRRAKYNGGYFKPDPNPELTQGGKDGK